MGEEKEQNLRLPIAVVLTALGTALGFFMSYVFSPLEARVTEAEKAIQETRREVTRIQSDVDHLERKR